MIDNAGIFRDQCAGCAWIFDLFAYGFDFLNGRFIPVHDDDLEDNWSLAEEEVSRRNIVSDIVAADGTIPESLRRYLDVPGGDAEIQSAEFYVRLFSALSAIDRAAADLNYLNAQTRQTGSRWFRVTEYFERHGKQLQRDATGYVVFKPRYFERAPYLKWANEALNSGRWTRIPQRGEYLERYFENLLRVFAPTDSPLDFRILNPTQDFHDLSWTTLKLGVVPLIQELKVGASDAKLLPGPLLLRKETASPPSFGIQIDGNPEDACLELCDRAEAGLTHLAKQGCQIVMFPEMVMPDPVVKRVKAVLARLAAENCDRPCLTLAGTFTRLIPLQHATKPFNVAVVLNHRGEELWRQQKAQPYDMQIHEQQRFGLDALLQCDSCRENIAYVPRRLLSIDSRATGMRMIVLICEDLTRDPGTYAVRALQPTFVFTPVMAGPLEPSGGFALSVDHLAHDTDGIFLVGNSGALASAAWKKQGHPPLALVGLPLLNVAHSHRAFEVIDKIEAVPNLPDMQVLIFQFPG